MAAAVAADAATAVDFHALILLVTLQEGGGHPACKTGCYCAGSGDLTGAGADNFQMSIRYLLSQTGLTLPADPTCRAWKLAIKTSFVVVWQCPA